MAYDNTTDAVMAAVNWDVIAEAIRAEPLEHWSYEDAAKIVWNVANRFFVRDIGQCIRVVSVEAPFTVHFAGGAEVGNVIHGFTDVVLESNEGDNICLDWKTASKLGRDWENDLADSWQWRIYGAVTGANTILYRGLDKTKMWPKIPGQPHDWSKASVKELVFHVDPNGAGDVWELAMAASAMRQSLVQLVDNARWPRRMPDACTQFGTRCTFWDICRDKAPLPAGQPPVKAWSYSGLNRFMNCPENWRLDAMTNQRTSSRATDFGSAVHRGLAKLYEQFNEIKLHLEKSNA